MTPQPPEQPTLERRIEMWRFPYRWGRHEMIYDHPFQGDEFAGCADCRHLRSRHTHEVAAAPDPAPEPTKWEWHGDWPVGVRHGAGDGWLHVHPDGTRWIHPEKVCEAAAPDPVASRLLRELVMFLSTPTPVRGELARTLAEARRFLATEGEADWTPTDLGEGGR